MKTHTHQRLNCRRRSIGIALVVLAMALPLEAGESTQPRELRVHEWGTVTTLHGFGGSGLSWYQPGAAPVSQLPAFVRGNGTGKIGLFSARMETPVLYFYTDAKQTVDVSVDAAKFGIVTEYYPDFTPHTRGWKQLELLPPSQAGDLVSQLPVDSALPDNHYYEARAVPEAAFVRRSDAPDQLEKFLFYRGAGSFFSGYKGVLGPAGRLNVRHYNRDHAMEHGWVVQSSAEAVRWRKLPAFPAYDPATEQMNADVELARLDAHGSRVESIENLKASMASALRETGLSSAEARAMIATWDEHWYEEPGQRIFSIVPQGFIDEILPLAITPKPSELVRVFVHRAELLSPETLQALELAMAPTTDLEVASKRIAEEELGRFVRGAIDAVARQVGWRTEQAYKQRGAEALKASEKTTVAAAQ